MGVDESKSTATDESLSKSTVEASPFNKEQIEMLQKMMQQAIQNTSISSTATLSPKGNFSTAIHVNHQKTNQWIVDSGASDHMTGDINVFTKYTSCQDESFVRIADGTASKVAGKDSVIITKDITLDSVLHVPKLNCSLLSICKLTKNLKNFTT